MAVPRDVEAMVTFLKVNGAMVYVNSQGNTFGYEDVFSKIDMCKRYYKKIGLASITLPSILDKGIVRYKFVLKAMQLHTLWGG